MKPWLIILLCVVGGFLLLMLLKNLLFSDPDMRYSDGPLDGSLRGGGGYLGGGWVGLLLDFFFAWFWW